MSRTWRRVIVETAAETPILGLARHDHRHPGRVHHRQADRSHQHSGKPATTVAAHYDELRPI
jgi:hypothetical protein